MSDYTSYIGRQSRQRDFITPAMIERYRAVIGDEGRAVSYTHLTLPTIYSV